MHPCRNTRDVSILHQQCQIADLFCADTVALSYDTQQAKLFQRPRRSSAHKTTVHGNTRVKICTAKYATCCIKTRSQLLTLLYQYFAISCAVKVMWVQEIGALHWPCWTSHSFNASEPLNWLCQEDGPAQSSHSPWEDRRGRQLPTGAKAHPRQ